MPPKISYEDESPKSLSGVALEYVVLGTISVKSSKQSFGGGSSLQATMRCRSVPRESCRYCGLTRGRIARAEMLYRRVESAKDWETDVSMEDHDRWDGIDQGLARPSSLPLGCRPSSCHSQVQRLDLLSPSTRVGCLGALKRHRARERRFPQAPRAPLGHPLRSRPNLGVMNRAPPLDLRMNPLREPSDCY